MIQMRTLIFAVALLLVGSACKSQPAAHSTPSSTPSATPSATAELGDPFSYMKEGASSSLKMQVSVPLRSGTKANLVFAGLYQKFPPRCTDKWAMCMAASPGTAIMGLWFFAERPHMEGIGMDLELFRQTPVVLSSGTQTFDYRYSRRGDFGIFELVFIVPADLRSFKLNWDQMAPIEINV